jgi:NAD(P)-dependent dehydrogenase (short-subunit alcohol dehydrogenase family)
MALAVSADVTDYGQVEAAAQQIEETLGPIDVWVNAAFSSVFAPFAATRPEEFRRVTEVTYLGFVYGTMAALARMRPRDRGVIVQVGSALGDRSIPLLPPTAAASMRSTVLPPHCVVSSCTTSPTCTSPWCRCPR